MSNDLTISDQPIDELELTAASSDVDSATPLLATKTAVDEPDSKESGSGRSSRFSSFNLETGARVVLAPLMGIGVFMLLWAAIAPQIETSLGTLPGPTDVLDAGVGLYDDWQAEREAEKLFYEDQEVRNAAAIAEGRADSVTDFTYAGSPTFPDQIWTSLRTVALGFLIGSLVAIPLGLLAGLSRWVNAAINPLVQIFRPVSPLAWLPIVTLVVAATITSNDPFLAKAFVTSAIVVALNSLWPTLLNTSVGAASVDQDLLNVAKVLRLSWFTKLRKVVLPSALPYIFTGLRLSLGVGWMVLIAAEMLAQNPGLGKFVWDEFQNGSSESLSRIMFAVFVIGIIGFILDRLMSALEKFVGRNHAL